MALLTIEAGRRSLQRVYLRWTLAERLQHAVLLASFLVLVVTGFSLAYPESWWARPFTGSPVLFELGRDLHRIAGTALLALAAVHIVYLASTERGRTMAAALRPGRADLAELRETIAFLAGRREAPPPAGHFTYSERFEYLGVVWGTAIMGLTGLMLWFETLTLRLFPKWVLDLMATVHLYEAWLAALTILVGHIYRVVFDPDVYPLDRSMFTGLVTENELRRRRSLEWREIVRRRRRGPRSPPPPP
ncbi:MAG: DUF4405 domain-containing protein, partial [Acidobacteria bacterium]